MSNAYWDNVSQRIIATVPGVQNGNTRHNYTISLSGDDFAELIAVVGRTVSTSDPTLLREKLNGLVREITSLLACAVSLAPAPIREEEDVAEAG